MLNLTPLVLSLLVLGAQPVFAQARTPQAVADELLAADTAFSTASATTDLVSGLSAMFREDVVLLSAGRLIEGRPAAIEALRANADNLKTRLRWTAVRAGVSADGEHGFTLGFMLAERDGKPEPLKYLAYWIKDPSGWRVAVYKRVRAAGDSAVPAATMPPSLPAAIVAPSRDATLLARHRETLGDAERAFSADAQMMGLGPAFAKYGSADAINLGGPNVPAFVVGNTAIGDYVGKGAPQPQSPVTWGPDRVIVASSGDLGVTIGWIKRKAAEEGQPQSTPFFTIWRRASVADPWRYIAE